ncbi:hypothetical protein FGG08_000740 [Glutinoglossum americanum]|uniref:Major facilitator superfamily (MFS) profile domain-containing protein n=1 Tax=Glutinoglossum americanum TaxID=1670608 RepID=A0A9P8L0X5_9PEZI|nr:hypothetical protein FGG08_000740 [Glutinoglossum americanum]
MPPPQGAGSRAWTNEVTVYLILLVAITTIGPLQFGYHLAELNAPQDVITCEKESISTSNISLDIPQCIPMSAGQFGLVSSIFTLGGLFGALCAGPISSHYGRLLAMRLATIFFVVGPVFEAIAPSISMISFGRLISGIGAGAAVVAVPIYISEIAPPQGKGFFGAMTQVMTNLGILITQTLGLFLSRGQLWRAILAIAGVIGLLQALGLTCVVESPKWMAANGNPARAKRNLQKIRGEGVAIESEVNSWGIAGIRRSLTDHPYIAEEEQSLLRSPGGRTGRGSGNSAKQTHIGFLEVAMNSHYRPAIISVVGVMLAQQFCGINSIIMYSVSLLSEILPTTSALLSVGVSVVNLVATFSCAPLADRWGRKPCLLLSIAGMGSSSLLLAIGILYSLAPLSAVATLTFVLSFAVGLGPVPFILASELVEQEAVGATQGWALAANWTATFVVAQFFPLLNAWMGQGKVYFLFAALAAGFFVFVAVGIPETSGKKSIDEVWGRKSAERRAD